MNDPTTIGCLLGPLRALAADLEEGRELGRRSRQRARRRRTIRPHRVVAWATLGAGLAAIAPTLFGTAPAVSATSPPVAIPAIATWGYLGSFTGPPLIGALAQ